MPPLPSCRNRPRPVYSAELIPAVPSRPAVHLHQSAVPRPPCAVHRHRRAVLLATPACWVCCLLISTKEAAVRLPHPVVPQCRSLVAVSFPMHMAWHSTDRIGSDSPQQVRVASGSKQSPVRADGKPVRIATRYLTKAGSLTPGTQLFSCAVPLADADRLHPAL